MKRAEAERKDARVARPRDKAQRDFSDPESKIKETGDGFTKGVSAACPWEPRSPCRPLRGWGA